MEPCETPIPLNFKLEAVLRDLEVAGTPRDPLRTQPHPSFEIVSLVNVELPEAVSVSPIFHLVEVTSKERKAKACHTYTRFGVCLQLSLLCTSFRSPHNTLPRWRILPPEIIHIVVQLLKDDKITPRTRSLATREFSQVALSCIGRHITVNHVPCIKLLAQLLVADLAFQPSVPWISASRARVQSPKTIGTNSSQFLISLLNAGP